MSGSKAAARRPLFLSRVIRWIVSLGWAGTLAAAFPAEIVNGGFESGYLGWTYSGNLGLAVNDPTYPAAEGETVVLFNAGQKSPDGQLSQVIETVPGTTYRVDFTLGAFSMVNRNVQRMQVTVQGEELLESREFLVQAPGDGVRYLSASLHFVADSATSTISFADITTAGLNADMLLDDVTISEPSPGLLLNGSFEEGNHGWNLYNNVVIRDGAEFLAPDGTKVAVFNDSDFDPVSMGGELWQSVATIPGQRYSLRFRAGVIGSSTDQFLRVAIFGSDTLVDRTFRLIGLGPAPHYWEKAVSFVADSTSTTLLFEDVGTTTVLVDMLLDDVRLQEEDADLPWINEALQDQGVPVGGDLAWTVSVEHADSLTFQWRRNGLDIEGATRQEFRVESASFEDAGDYQVAITSEAGTTVSSEFRLFVLPESILMNGSFETGSLGWTFSGNVATSTKPLYQFSDGQQMAHFNFGDRPSTGSISQRFPTSPGETYRLELDLGAFSLAKRRTQSAEIVVEGASVLLQEIVTVESPGNGTEYFRQAFTFVADDTSAQLIIRDTSTETASIDLALDNVRISRVTSSPPDVVTPRLTKTTTGFLLQIQGIAGHHYEIQRSEDLLNWIPITTLQVSSDGSGSFEDSHPPSKMASYRVVPRP